MTLSRTCPPTSTLVARLLSLLPLQLTIQIVLEGWENLILTESTDPVRHRHRHCIADLVCNHPSNFPEFSPTSATQPNLAADKTARENIRKLDSNRIIRTTVTIKKPNVKLATIHSYNVSGAEPYGLG